LVMLALPAACIKTKSSLKSATVLDLGTRPVMEVVRLLQDMKVQLQAEMDDDSKVHQKLRCWCEATEREKVAAISTGNAGQAQLTSDIVAATAKIAELKHKRQTTFDEVNNNKQSLQEATEIRLKESKDFAEQEQDYLEAVGAAHDAIVVLSTHQLPTLAQLRFATHQLLDSKVVQSSNGVTREAADTLQTMLQATGASWSFLQVPNYQNFVPQSNQVLGVCKQMKEDFEEGLSELRKSEAQRVQEFRQVRKAKDGEITLGANELVKLDGDLAELMTMHALAEREKVDTTKQLALDTKFLDNLKKKCRVDAAEYDDRVKGRMAEISAMEDAFEILSSDESLTIFDKLSFIQTASRRCQGMARRRAVLLLQSFAGRSGSAQLAALATSAHLDEFSLVKEHINDMVSELKKQQQEEVDQRDQCIDDIAVNSGEIAAAHDKIVSLTSKNATLNKDITELNTAIATEKQVIADTKSSMATSSQTREAENAVFQQTLADHRLMFITLQKAINRMKQVYFSALQNQLGASQIQNSSAGQDPGDGPAEFKTYTQADGSRVVALLEGIQEDIKKTTDEAVKDDERAKAEYESLMKDSNRIILTAKRAISDMSGELARKQEESLIANSDLAESDTELSRLSVIFGDLHGTCDFLLRNFAARQAARSQEVDALNEAKAILSGSQ